MTAIKKQLVLSLVLLCGAAALTTVLYLNRPPSAVQPPAFQPVAIDVARVVPETVHIPVQAQGTVTPLQQTVMLSEVQGRVIEVSDKFLVGGFAQQGEVLLRIDPRDYQAALLRAQAAVESADSALAQERGRAEVALREWQKLPSNSQRSQEAKELYLRKPQLEQAEAQARAARADLDTARDDLERTIIRAPYDALIRSRDVDLGQFVARGTRLTELYSVDTAEVRLPIPQGKLAYLDLPGLQGYAEGTAIDLYTDVAGDVKHWPATLHRTEGTFDERSRVLYAVARVEDPYGLEKDQGAEPLRFGTFVNANIKGKAFEGIVVLPRHATRAGNQVWIVSDNQVLRSRQVETLRAGDRFVYISGGLKEGELVSLTPLDASFGGSIAEVVTETPSNRLRETDGMAPMPVPEASISMERDGVDTESGTETGAS